MGPEHSLINFSHIPHLLFIYFFSDFSFFFRIFLFFFFFRWFYYFFIQLLADPISRYTDRRYARVNCADVKTNYDVIGRKKFGERV
jgi:hypothetical protein